VGLWLNEERRVGLV